jgi:hypothetical protein
MSTEPEKKQESPETEKPTDAVILMKAAEALIVAKIQAWWKYVAWGSTIAGAIFVSGFWTIAYTTATMVATSVAKDAAEKRVEALSNIADAAKRANDEIAAGIKETSEIAARVKIANDMIQDTDMKALAKLHASVSSIDREMKLIYRILRNYDDEKVVKMLKLADSFNDKSILLSIDKRFRYIEKYITANKREGDGWYDPSERSSLLPKEDVPNTFPKAAPKPEE